MRRALVVVAAGVMVAACSGPSADPADVSDLSDTLTSSTSPLGLPLDDKQAECIARVYLEAGLSGEALDALDRGEPLAPHTDDDAKAIEKITAKMPDCLS